MTDERSGDVRSKMEGLKNMFAAVEDRPDPTAELPRPGATRGLAALADSPATPAAQRERQPAHAATPRPKPPRQRPVADGSAPTATTAASPAALEPRRKTSLSIPNSLRADLSRAFTEQRWTFAQLAEMAAQRLRDGTISEADVDRWRRSAADEPMTIKTVNLPTSTLAIIDHHAAAWRYSRSQLMAVAVAMVVGDLIPPGHP